MNKDWLLLLFLCAATIVSSGCIGGSDAAPQKNRFALNAVELANGSAPKLIVDFNYTASRTYPDLTFYFGPSFFWVEKDGANCTVETSRGVEMGSGSIFESSNNHGLDGREYDSFNVGRGLDGDGRHFRIAVDAKLNESCAVREGDAVRVRLSAVENQNNLDDVINPYYETVQGIVSAGAFGSAYERYSDSTKGYYNSMRYYKEKVIVSREAFDAYSWKFLPTGADGTDFEITVRKMNSSTPMTFEALAGEYPFSVFKVKNNLMGGEYADCQLEKSSLTAIDENGHQMEFVSGGLNVSSADSFTLKGKITGCDGTKGEGYEYKAVVGSINTYDYQRNYTDVFLLKGTYD